MPIYFKVIHWLDYYNCFSLWFLNNLKVLCRKRKQLQDLATEKFKRYVYDLLYSFKTLTSKSPHVSQFWEFNNDSAFRSDLAPTN